MNRAAANRVTLWLRAERAMGMSQVPLSRSALRPRGQIKQTSLPAQQPTRAERQPSAPIAAERVVSTKAVDDAVLPDVLIPDAPAATLTTSLPFDSPVLSVEEKRQQLSLLDENQVRGCTKCRLCQTRTQTVFGEGSPEAPIFFIGEGPGENEDLQGRPFVGKAGQLLDRMIIAMGLRREQVYIANIVKCRPPNNRVPMPDEVGACGGYLEKQLEIVRPRAIVTLGLPATRHMLQLQESMGRMRGRLHQWRGIPLMPTYHPAYILRTYTEQTRAAVWSDLKQVMQLLELPVPEQKNGVTR